MITYVNIHSIYSEVILADMTGEVDKDRNDTVCPTNMYDSRPLGGGEITCRMKNYAMLTTNSFEFSFLLKLTVIFPFELKMGMSIMRIFYINISDID